MSAAREPRMRSSATRMVSRRTGAVASTSPTPRTTVYSYGATSCAIDERRCRRPGSSPPEVAAHSSITRSQRKEVRSVRRLVLLLAGAALWLMLAALPTLADGGPHVANANSGVSTLTADSCAGCHRAHTAEGAYL